MRFHFLLIALAIISSGCVSLPGVPGSSTGGPGIVIDSLTFNPVKINSNQLTKLMLIVENKGSFNVQDPDSANKDALGEAQLYLFGLPNDWTTEQEPDSTSFSIMAPGLRGGKQFPGEKKEFWWLLRAPSGLPRDETFSFDARTRVCYPYKTIVTGKMEVVSESEWLNTQPKQHQIVTQQSSGPLKVDILSTQPLIADTETKVKLRIANIGDGTVTGNDCSAFQTTRDETGTEEAVTNLNKLTIEGNECTFEDEGIYLQKGQFKELLATCTPPLLESKPVSTDEFKLEFDYNYYVDKSATVLVEGTAEGSAIGGGGGGGAGATITLKDVCSKSCDATKQIYKTGSPAIGMCADKSLSVVKYPGTSVDVAIMPLDQSAMGLLSTIFGSDYSKATIKSLGLHDEKTSDLNLQTMTVGLLDTKTTSVQYEKASYLKSRDKVGIVSYLCNSIGDGMKVSDTYVKGGDCTTMLPTLPLSTLVDINGASGYSFKDNPVSGLTIGSIIGRSISDITGGNLSAINVEDFNLSSIETILSGAPITSGQFYLQYVKCADKNVVSPYGPDTLCQCVIGIAGLTYGPYDGVSNSACTAACPRTVDGKRWADGGACNLFSARGTGQCRGTTLVTYHAGATPTNPANACDPKVCLCYDTTSMSSIEAALVCR